MNTDAVLDVRGVKFGYDKADTLLHIEALKIQRGESVFLRGPSGSGKSTLLGLIGGVLNPRQGQISICGLGIIFQQLNLLPYLNILQNVTLPCRFSASRAKRAESQTGSINQAAQHLIQELGITDNFLNRNVGTLSIGQQQRVAVARALIGGPELIIADEPTSALDSDNRERFIELLDAQRTRSIKRARHETAHHHRVGPSVNLGAPLYRATDDFIHCHRCLIVHGSREFTAGCKGEF